MVQPAGTLGRDAVVVIVGIVAWAVFGFLLHGPLIGVAPLAAAGALPSMLALAP